jgi:ribonuclease VapC
MVIDTSALVAIVLAENDAAWFRDRLLDPEPCRLSAVTSVEAQIVLSSRVGADAVRDLQLLVEGIGASVEPVDSAQAQLAFSCWLRFGKGRHPAGLNLGDCFSYALARVSGEPLLFKGDDFTQTDILAVS